MILNTIIAIIFSFSVRSPALNEMPFDYEARIGGKGNNYSISILTERENNLYGYGEDITYTNKFDDTLFYQVISYVRNTKYINSKTFDVYKKYKQYKYGVAASLTDLEYLDLLLFAGYKQKYLNFEIRFNHHRYIANCSLGIEHKLNNKILLHPFIKYYKNNDKSDYQIKIELQYLI